MGLGEKIRSLLDKLLARKEIVTQGSNIGRVEELHHKIVREGRTYGIMGEKTRWIDWEDYTRYNSIVGDVINKENWRQLLDELVDDELLIATYQGSEGWALDNKELLPSFQIPRGEREPKIIRFYFPTKKAARWYRKAMAREDITAYFQKFLPRNRRVNTGKEEEYRESQVINISSEEQIEQLE